jgi:hypothetical protein
MAFPSECDGQMQYYIKRTSHFDNATGFDVSSRISSYFLNEFERTSSNCSFKFTPYRFEAQASQDHRS